MRFVGFSQLNGRPPCMDFKLENTAQDFDLIQKLALASPTMGIVHVPLTDEETSLLADIRWEMNNANNLIRKAKEKEAKLIDQISQQVLRSERPTE